MLPCSSVGTSIIALVALYSRYLQEVFDIVERGSRRNVPQSERNALFVGTLV